MIKNNRLIIMQQTIHVSVDRGFRARENDNKLRNRKIGAVRGNDNYHRKRKSDNKREEL